MRIDTRYAKAFALAFVVFTSAGLHGKDLTIDMTKSQYVQQEKSASAMAAQAWLDQVDQNRYDQSWDHSSSMMRRTISKGEWEKVLNTTRHPLGGVTKRTMVQQLPAQNPKNMPRGDYMVILYQTSFAGKPQARELVTMSFENGEWRVLTYMINK